ncbi:MAG: polysaccharide deacetylase family protein, partial [Chloroflexota bacterium]
ATMTITPGTNLANLCETTIAPLKNNKRWVWSHGFDDNQYLVSAIDAFKAKSWPATLFLIAKDYRQDRQETHWIIDEPYVNSQILTTEGWAIGNHSWDHERFETENPTIEDYQKDIRDSQEKLEASIDRSSNPDLRIISFASPNFSDKYEQPFADVSATTDLILLETGADFLITVNEDSSYSNDDLSASPFSGRNKIGRDASIEWAPEVVIGIMDWMSANSSDYRRFWYNSLAHGSQEENIQTVLDHAWNNYGPGGTDELWVATSSEVYSYLITRDSASVSVQMTENDGSEPEIDLENPIYLPMITAMKNWASQMVGDPAQDQVQNLLLKVSGHGLQQIKDK